MKKFAASFTFICLVGLLLASFVTESSAQSDRPNIIMMMADDMGWGDVTFSVRLGETAGGADVNYSGTNLWNMPNLESMAQNGLKFSRMYSQSPVCSPTRASVLTGRAPQRMGIDFANTGNMENRETTIAEYASSLGYRTGIFGKWHLGSLTRDVADSNRGGPGSFGVYSTPINNGFDTQYVTESRVATYNPGNSPLTSTTRYWTGPGEFIDPNSPDLQGDDSLIVARETNAFIQDAAGDNEPFMAVSWFHTPHLPTADPSGNQNNLSAYRFAMEGLDAAIGQIRDQVAALGLENDTIIMFNSDNGAEDGHNYPQDDGLRNNKRELHEGGIRTPGIIEWNGTIAAGETHTPAVTTDYLPTLLDIWGIDAVDDRPLDGASITETLFGDRSAPRQKSIITRSTNGHQAVIGEEGRYKLISTNNGSFWELYDLVVDFGEENALATTSNVNSASPELRTIFNGLLGDYSQWETSVNVSRAGNFSGDFETRVASISGGTLAAEPPEFLRSGDVRTGESSILYLERQHATLVSDLDVNSLGEEGSFTRRDNATLEEGLVVNSFLFHFNPTDGVIVFGDEISITFEDEILAVIGDTSDLEGSDYLSFADPNFELSSGRGLDNTDSWTIDEDGFTITFDVRASNSVDQARILTASTLNVVPGPGGDFNDDGVYDCQDIDSLVSEIAGGNNDGNFDLNGDGAVDSTDLDLWRAEAGEVNLASGNPYLEGDANLDGFVDASDFNIWNSNSFTNQAAWCSGDFNADGAVDAADFNVWNENRFQSSADHPAAVPEPNGIFMILVGMLMLAIRRRR